MADNFESAVITRRAESVWATNAVLRNTYFLLSLTLIFSSACAWFSTVSNAPQLNIFITLILMYGLMFLTMRLKNSIWGIPCIFLFTGFMGYLLGPMLNYYLHNYINGGELIMTAVGTTGVVFLALSGYVLTTKKNFNFLSGFIFAGCITGIVLMVASIWIHTTGLQLAISGVFSLLSCAMILYHTSAIVNGGERNYIMATVSLYIALFNLFTSLLQIFGAFSGNRN